MSATRTGESTVHPRNIIGHSHVHAASTARLPHVGKQALQTATCRKTGTVNGHHNNYGSHAVSLAARTGSSTHTLTQHCRCSTLQVVLAARIIQARTTSALIGAAPFRSCWLLVSYKPVLHPRSLVQHSDCNIPQTVRAAHS